MSRRSVTTIQAQVTLRLPPGVKSDKALEFIRTALRTADLELQNPLAALDFNSITVRLVKKETTYL